MAQFCFVALNLLVYAAIAISLLMWANHLLRIFGIRSFASNANLDPRIGFVNRSPPFWNAADFLVMFGSLVLAGSGISMFFVAQGWIPKPPAPLATEIAVPQVKLVMGTSELYARTYVGLLASILSMSVAMGFVLLAQRNKRDAIQQLGFNFDKTTLKQGLLGSLWLIPPVLVLSLLVSALIPYKHPVLETLAAIVAQRSFFGFTLIFVSTAIITPVVEEFMFRVLFQGGLQGMIDRPREDDRNFSTLDSNNWQARSWWPIVLTSLLFAGMHLGQGAAPIPLFFLSLGLGYLYRQTGSILPPLIVHMVLNGTTTIVEFTRLLAM